MVQQELVPWSTLLKGDDSIFVAATYQTDGPNLGFRSEVINEESLQCQIFLLRTIAMLGLIMSIEK